MALVFVDVDETPEISFDPTLARIVQQAAERHEVSVGYLRRFVSEEARVSHLARRHGLFERLRSLSRGEPGRRQVRTADEAEL